jgi:DNA excision repair protein ERCC-6
LRKLCNHPDLLQRGEWGDTPGYGSPERSGKLLVALRVVPAWAARGHKALVFAQTRQALDILEGGLRAAGLACLRMDGGTPIRARSRLVDAFNADALPPPGDPGAASHRAAWPVFLLTTRVGGLGVNLTGADRVLLFDADWNPSTDAQARERAWRLGQRRDVVIYRLIAAGTIEEKVYHRQVFKQFVADRVLGADPRQRRFFRRRDLADLFTLAPEEGPPQEGAGGCGGGAPAAAGQQQPALRARQRGGAAGGAQTETARLFAGAAAGVDADTLAAEAGGGGGGQGGEAALDAWGLPAGEAGAEGAEGRGRGGSARAPCPQDEGDPAPPPAPASAAEARFLASLFGGGGGGGGGGEEEGGAEARGGGARACTSTLLAGALDHALVEAAAAPAATRVEAAAARAAARAAAALAASAAACGEAGVHVPTWTGRRGAAGAGGGAAAPPPLQPLPPAAAPRFGSRLNPALGGASSGAEGAIRSADLLARLRARAGGGVGGGAAAGPPPPPSAPPTEADALAARLAAFLAAQPGRAAGSDVLLARCAGGLSALSAPLFRQVLRAVARLRPVPGGVGGGGGGARQWELRRAYWGVGEGSGVD